MTAITRLVRTLAARKCAVLGHAARSWKEWPVSDDGLSISCPDCGVVAVLNLHDPI